jgi:hypothetical protein
VVEGTDRLERAVAASVAPVPPLATATVPVTLVALPVTLIHPSATCASACGGGNRQVSARSGRVRSVGAAVGHRQNARYLRSQADCGERPTERERPGRSDRA